jgi:hypothetical protein
MPRSPSIVSQDTKRDVYLVLNDFGSLGRVWRETDEAGTNRVWMVRSLLVRAIRKPGPHRRLQYVWRLVARRDFGNRGRTAPTLFRDRRVIGIDPQVFGDGQSAQD